MQTHPTALPDITTGEVLRPDLDNQPSPSPCPLRRIAGDRSELRQLLLSPPGLRSADLADDL